MNKKNTMKLPTQDKIYYTFVYVYIIILTLAVLIPLINILASSFSSPAAVYQGKVRLLPVDFSVVGYEKVLLNKKVWVGYKNTVFYTVVGTALNVAMTLACAYPLTRKGLPFRNFFTFLFAFTMLFSGGLIPTYLLIQKLGLLNTRLVMILPGAMAIYQMIITRTFIQNSIPLDLLEMAQIDGCNDFRFFFEFILPLSKAVIAVIALQYAVGHWNEYFSAFIYLTDQELYPLQSFLREILTQNMISTADIADPETAVAMQGMADLLKYSLIVVATAPILCIYPFVQKYFVKGVMIGSLKG